MFKKITGLVAIAAMACMMTAGALPASADDTLPPTDGVSLVQTDENTTPTPEADAAEAQRLAEEEQAKADAEAQRLADEAAAKEQEEADAAEAQRLAEEEQAKADAEAQRLAEEEADAAAAEEPAKVQKEDPSIQPVVNPEPEPVADPYPTDEAWTPKSTLDMYPVECVGPTGFPALISGDVNTVEGETISEIRIDGKLQTGDGEQRAGVGPHEFSYVVTNDKTGETVVKTGTFVVEACAVEVWTPKSTLSLKPLSCVKEGASEVSISGTSTSAEGETIVTVYIDGQAIVWKGDGTVASLPVGTHTFRFDVRNDKTGEIKNVSGDAFEVVSCPPQPIEVAPTGAPSWVDMCGTMEDTFTVQPNGKGYYYEVTDERVDGIGTVFIDLKVEQGYTLKTGTQAHWEHNFTSEPCVINVDAPPMPKFTDPCGPDNIAWTETPADTESAHWVKNLDGSWTVGPTATVLPNGAHYFFEPVTYQLKDSGVACEVVTPPTTPTPNPEPTTPPTKVTTPVEEEQGDDPLLAITGQSDVSGPFWMALGLFGFGVALMVRRRARA